MAERALLQDGRRKNRQGLILALLFAGACAAPKEQIKIVGDYIAAHPELTLAEVSRLQFRNGTAGDTLERLKIAWTGCQFELNTEDKFIAVYTVHVPVDGQKIRLGDPASPENIYAGGQVMVTLDHRKLMRWTILDIGMHLP
jgi:hypothetical protein